MGAGSESMHYVFSAECNHALTWQAVVLFHSHTLLKIKHPMTRLLACSEAQLKTYRGIHIGPTFVHHNMRFGHESLIDEIGYPSYNKPASVMFWLQQTNPTEEYIAMLDTDMILRAPLHPIALGARRGVVVSAEYNYLVGTETEFADRWLTTAEKKKAAKVGGFHIFHREDIRAIAPLWIQLTREIRAFAAQEPELYMNESFLNWKTDQISANEDVKITKRKQSLWQAEMYGYAFAAARTGVSTIMRSDLMLYPGYVPWPAESVLPSILHYGAHYAITRESGVTYDKAGLKVPQGVSTIVFNKMYHTQLNLFQCEKQNVKNEYFFFEVPPPEAQLSGRPVRDLLCIQHLRVMNSAFCEFYKNNCDTEMHPLICPDDIISDSIRLHWWETWSDLMPSAGPAAHRPFDPESPLVSYHDMSACGARGDDAVVDLSKANCSGRIALVSRFEGGSHLMLGKVTIKGCEYYSYDIMRCDSSKVYRMDDIVKSEVAASVQPLGKKSSIEGAMRASCVDESDECFTYARQGACAANPTYMMHYCAQTCGACSARALIVRGTFTGIQRYYGMNKTDDHALHVARRHLNQMLNRHSLLGQAGEIARQAHLSGRILFVGARIQYRLSKFPDESEQVISRPFVCDERFSDCTGDVCAAVELDEGPPLEEQCFQSEATLDLKYAAGNFTQGYGTASFGQQLRCANVEESPLIAVGDLCAKCNWDLRGKVLLVKRGNCSFNEKAEIAFHAGAAAVLLYDPHQPSSENTAMAMSSSPGFRPKFALPVLSIPRKFGDKLNSILLATGSSLDVCSRSQRYARSIKAVDLIMDIQGIELFVRVDEGEIADLLDYLDSGCDVAGAFAERVVHLDSPLTPDLLQVMRSTIECEECV